MIRRLFVSLVALGLLAPLTGCGQSALRQEVINTRNAAKDQMDLLKKNNELLNRRLNELNAQVDKLKDSNRRLSDDLAQYSNRPEEVKLEIIGEVNTRFQAVGRKQDDFIADMNNRFEQRATTIQAGLDDDTVEMQKILDQHTTFAWFVATEQDSINRVFANRFDSRPWYQSIIGKWEDRNRESPVGPPSDESGGGR